MSAHPNTWGLSSRLVVELPAVLQTVVEQTVVEEIVLENESLLREWNEEICDEMKTPEYLKTLLSNNVLQMFEWTNGKDGKIQGMGYLQDSG